jgi:hypothetical protein
LTPVHSIKRRLEVADPLQPGLTSTPEHDPLSLIKNKQAYSQKHVAKPPCAITKNTLFYIKPKFGCKKQPTPASHTTDLKLQMQTVAYFAARTGKGFG